MAGEHVLSVLQRRYPERGIGPGHEAWQAALIPAAHAAVGDVAIQVDDDELTAFIGTITHVHFQHDDEISDPQVRFDEALSRLLAYLDDLLSERLVVWCFLGWVRGSSVVRGSELPSSGLLVRRYAWSGPRPLSWRLL